MPNDDLISQGSGVDSLRQLLHDDTTLTLLDISQLSDYELCGRLYKHRYIDGLPVKIGLGALFSKYVIHPLLGRWYMSGAKEAIGNVEQAFKEFITAADESSIRPSARQLQAYSLKSATDLLTAYTDKYLFDEAALKVVDVEGIYWAILPDVPQVVFVSKPDVVLTRIGSDGAKITLDFKTSLYREQQALLPFDRQFLGQAFVTGSTFMMKAYGLIKLDSQQQYAGCDVDRDLQAVDHDLLAEFVTELTESAGQFVASKASNVWIKRAPKACHPYPGIECSFIKYCRLGKYSQAMIAMADKTNPLEYLGL